MSANPGPGVRVVLGGPMTLLCPRCLDILTVCRCGRYLLEGQADPSENGVYQVVPLGEQPPKVGNRHYRRKRKVMARRRGR